MSGIYISGVEAPKTCYECYRRGLKSVVGCTHDIVGISKNREEKIPSWCRIKHVPDHGRVCDLDKLIEAFKGIAKQNINIASFPKSWGHAYYEVAEVADEITEIILPADKEKEV